MRPLPTVRQPASEASAAARGTPSAPAAAAAAAGAGGRPPPATLAAAAAPSPAAEGSCLHLELTKAEEAGTWASALAGHELAAADQQADQKRLLLERFQKEASLSSEFCVLPPRASYPPLSSKGSPRDPAAAAATASRVYPPPPPPPAPACCAAPGL